MVILENSLKRIVGKNLEAWKLKFMNQLFLNILITPLFQLVVVSWRVMLQELIYPIMLKKVVLSYILNVIWITLFNSCQRMLLDQDMLKKLNKFGKLENLYTMKFLISISLHHFVIQIKNFWN